MTNSDKKGAPATATPSNSDAENVPHTHYSGQGVSRLDFFAAAALQGMIARCPDGLAVFRLCVENASATANTAIFIAREMEAYARRNDAPPRRKRKGGAR